MNAKSVNLISAMVVSLILALGSLFSFFVIEKNILSYFLYVVLIILALYPAFRRKNFDVFEIINWMVLYFFISIGLRIPPIFFNYSLYLYDYGSTRYFNTVNIVIFSAICALISLYAGYYSSFGEKLSSRLPEVKLQFSTSRLFAFLSVGAIVNLIVFWVYIKDLGASGVNVLSAHEVTVSNVVEGGRSFYTLAGNIFSGTTLLAVYFFLHWKNKLWVKLFLLINVATVITNFMFVGSKGVVIYLFITIMVCYHYSVKPLKLAKVMLYMAPIVIISPFMWFYRAFGLQDLSGLAEKVVSIITREPFLIIEPFLSRSFGADMFFLIVDKTPSEFPFRLGGTFLAILWALIPRQIWPDKPWSLGVQFNNTYLVHAAIPDSSVSPSLIGEFFMNFHIPGVIVGFFLIGLLARVVFDYCTKKIGKFEGIAIYLFFFPILVQGLEGPFSDHYVYFPFFKVVSLIVLFVFFKGRFQKSAAVGSS